jgi:hypothetical protein
MTSTLRLAGALSCLAVLVAAPAHAQQRAWAITLEGGVSDMHGETAADGGAGALRVSRRMFGYEWMRGEVALTGGSADENRGFGTVELGVEFRLCATCRFTGFVGGGGGWLKETRWDGGMLRANVGVEARVWRRFSVRAMAQAGTHDGVRGPHLAMLGLTWRFGRAP